MIIERLRIDDDLYTGYLEETVQTHGDSTAILEVIADRLKRAVSLRPNSRYILLTDAARDAMENLLGGGSLKSADDLLTRVSRLAQIRFGDRVLKDLTPGMYEELALRAEKQGKTLDQMLDEAWRVFTRDFFTLVK